MHTPTHMYPTCMCACNTCTPHACPPTHMYLHACTPRHVNLTCIYTHTHAPHMHVHSYPCKTFSHKQRKKTRKGLIPTRAVFSFLLSSLTLVNPFDLLATKEEPPQERPPVNQTLTEVITEQANLSISAAHSSKVLYVITTSPSHPPQTVPGSHSWAPSVGASGHRVEGSSLNPYRNKGACGCFSFRHRLGYWLCNL